MLEGAARRAPGTALLGDERVLVRSDLPAAERRPVAVISGGGSVTSRRTPAMSAPAC